LGQDAGALPGLDASAGELAKGKGRSDARERVTKRPRGSRMRLEELIWFTILRMMTA
jgi:hypothetical protein